MEMGMGLEQEVPIHLMVLCELRALCFLGPAPQRFILLRLAGTTRAGVVTQQQNVITESEAAGGGNEHSQSFGVNVVGFCIRMPRGSH